MKDLRRKPIAVTALCSFLSVQLGTVGSSAQQLAADHQNNGAKHDRHDTETPIKHVIVIIGENRTFDNIYGTYVPKHGEAVSNLLSKGIVNADGSPGWNRGAAEQFKLTTINPVSLLHRHEHADQSRQDTVLAVPADARSRLRAAAGSDARAVPAQPGRRRRRRSTRRHSRRRICRSISPVLDKHDLPLLTTGFTGLANCTAGPGRSAVAVSGARHAGGELQPAAEHGLSDHRPPTAVRQRTPATWSTVSFTCGSSRTVPRSTRRSANPAGCRNDLYPFVGIARGDDSGGNAMGFYNVQQGDAPLFKRLADEYTMSDNYHQPVMGGTAVQHTMLMTGDQLPWESVGPFPASRRQPGGGSDAKERDRTSRLCVTSAGRNAAIRLSPVSSRSWTT